MSTPAPTLVPQLFQSASSQVVLALQGFMSALPDPVAGAPAINVPVYPFYHDTVPEPPFCTVKLTPGPHDFGVGESENDTYPQDWYADAPVSPTFNIYAPDCKLDCCVYATHPGQTEYLADSLYSGMVASYAMNPLTGEVVENAVGKHLAEAGITLTGLADWISLDSDPNAARPYGQYFQVHVVFRCNIDLMWTGGTSIVGPIQINQTLQGAQAITETFAIN